MATPSRNSRAAAGGAVRSESAVTRVALRIQVRSANLAPHLYIAHGHAHAHFCHLCHIRSDTRTVIYAINYTP
jgi:hypothetical protein